MAARRMQDGGRRKEGERPEGGYGRKMGEGEEEEGEEGSKKVVRLLKAAHLTSLAFHPLL